jgi:hypothetical protein
MAFKKAEQEIAVIKPANIQEMTISIKGTSPLVQNKMSEKQKRIMAEAMTTTIRKAKAAREARDYDREFKDAQHISEEGWIGIPCVAFRAALVDACRLTKTISMVVAKMAIFVKADGLDKEDATPLVRIYSPEPPEMHMGLVRIQGDKADIRARPMWRRWGCKVTIRYDADMVTGEGVINLLDKAGKQVGVQEGRHFSKNSVGCGWGEFEVVTTPQEDEVSPRRKSTRGKKYA